MAKTQRPRFYLGEWIAHRGLTFDQTAERAGLSKTHVVQLNNGKRRWNEGVLLKLAEGLELVNPLDLFRHPSDGESAKAIFDRIPLQMQNTAKRMLKSLAEPERLDYQAEPPVEPPKRRRRRG